MTLEKTLRSVCIAGVFALPFLVLYVANSMFFPFISGKNFAFRVIVEIIAGAWLALALVNPAYRPRRTWLLWAFGLWVVWMAIADAFGVYPFKSFFSNYERMEGWIMISHLFAYFVVAQSVLTTEKLWKQWWHTSLGVSLIVAFIGVLQLMGAVAINQSGVRLDARIGNSTYLGVYMLFHVFMAALYLGRAWVERLPGKRTGILFGYGAVILLDSFILFFTATRGAILGLIGGAALSALLLVLMAPRSRVAWRAGGVVVASLLILIGGFWAVREQTWVQNIEPLFRLAEIAREGFPLARQLNIGMAIQGFNERPILGWGQENYAAVFDKYYDPRMYAQEQWFDRTHNIIFDWLIAGGIFGLLGYLALYVFALLMVWRSGVFALYERAILTGLFAGYFFYLLFTFDNLTSYILFIAVLAYISVRAGATASNEPESLPAFSRKSLPYIASAAIVLVWIVAWFTNAQMIAGNRMLIQAISPQTAGPARNLEIFKEALSLERTGSQEIREQFSQATMSVIAAEGVPEQIKREFFEAATASMMEQANEAPLNARGPFFLGILLNRVSAFADAETALRLALERSPNKQGILFELGLNAFARNASEEAVGHFEKAYELEPRYEQARIAYANALIRTQQFDEASTIIRPFIESKSGATDLYLSLAGAYAGVGQNERAVEILSALRDAVPATAGQVDALIQQVRTGQVR